MTTEPSDELILPELLQSVIDHTSLQTYVGDLNACAQVLNVRVKARETIRTNGAGVKLEDAIAALISGQAFGVQVHYRYQGDEWTDTLTSAGGAYRVVRMMLPKDRLG